jgi:uncharacterized protein (TIGR02996 family)
MTDHDALYAAILAHPADDTPRLVYADWLQENDRAEEGEFIRVGCRVDALAPDHPDYSELLARKEELQLRLKSHVPGPRLKLGGGLYTDDGPDWWQWTYRGFPRFLQFNGQRHAGPKAIRDLTAALETAFTLIPSRWLVVRHVTVPQLALLLRQPVVEAIDTLTIQLSGSEGVNEAARIVAQAPTLGNLRGLSLVLDIDEAGVAAVAQSPNLGNLQWLSLPGETINEDSVVALGASSWFRNLRRLLLNGELPDAAFQALCGLAPFPNLHTLEVNHNEFSLASWQAFARSRAFPALTRLSALRGHLDAERMEAFVQARWFRPASLDLSVSAVDREGANLLMSGLCVESLQRLILRGNFLGPSGVARVAGNRKLTALRHLDLSHNTIGATGLRAIARNPALRGLIGLLLGGYVYHRGQLYPEHFQEFLMNLNLPKLRHLALDGRGIGPKAARAFSQAKFASLTRLDLTDCDLTDAAVAALLSASAMQNLIELRLEDNALSSGVEPLTDRGNLPRLGLCSLGTNRIPAPLARRLRRRAGVEL